jgi:cytochrome c oxidase subunit 3
MLTAGAVSYMHKMLNGWDLLINGLLVILFTMYVWWRDVIREATYEEEHSFVVRKRLRLGMVLFIVSEIMFFFAFFWAFFHSSLAPVFNIVGGIWPPKGILTMNTFGIPFTNTVLLLSSGATVTWSHHAIVLNAKRHTIIALIFTLTLAVLFTYFQGVEYVSAPFNISDGIYGSCFYLTTGFHGFHVFVETVDLFVAFVEGCTKNHFTNTQYFGFEAAIWYCHFVDVVLLFLYINVDWWGNLKLTVFYYLANLIY